MTTTITDRPIAIIHEHPDWFRPLFAELDRRGTPYVKVAAGGHSFAEEVILLVAPGTRRPARNTSARGIYDQSRTSLTRRAEDGRVRDL